MHGETSRKYKNYIGKGSQVAIDGRIQTRNYEREGQRVYFTEVVADSFEFLDTRASRERNQSSSNENDAFANTASNISPSDFPTANEGNDIKGDPFAEFGASIEINDDELPF